MKLSKLQEDNSAHFDTIIVLLVPRIHIWKVLSCATNNKETESRWPRRWCAVGIAIRNGRSCNRLIHRILWRGHGIIQSNLNGDSKEPAGRVLKQNNMVNRDFKGKEERQKKWKEILQLPLWKVTVCVWIYIYIIYIYIHMAFYHDFRQLFYLATNTSNFQPTDSVSQSNLGNHFTAISDPSVSSQCKGQFCNALYLKTLSKKNTSKNESGESFEKPSINIDRCSWLFRPPRFP